MFDLLTDPNAWLALVTLSALEIVLGIDNVVLISVLVSRLEPHRAARVRQLGLALALVFRIALLFAITWVMGLTQPITVLWGEPLSWNDVILIAGGLFLIAKATHEIHAEVETGGSGANPDETKPAGVSVSVGFAQVVL